MAVVLAYVSACWSLLTSALCGREGHGFVFSDGDGDHGGSDANRGARGRENVGFAITLCLPTSGWVCALSSLWIQPFVVVKS